MHETRMFSFLSIVVPCGTCGVVDYIFSSAKSFLGGVAARANILNLEDPSRCKSTSIQPFLFHDWSGSVRKKIKRHKRCRGRKSLEGFFVVSWFVMSSDGPKEPKRSVVGDGFGQRSCLSLSRVANPVYRTTAWSLSLSVGGGGGFFYLLSSVDVPDAGEDLVYGAHRNDWYVLSWHDGEGCIGCREHRRSKGKCYGVLRGVCASDA